MTRRKLGFSKNGLGDLNCPGDPGCPGYFAPTPTLDSSDIWGQVLRGFGINPGMTASPAPTVTSPGGVLDQTGGALVNAPNPNPASPNPPVPFDLNAWTQQYGVYVLLATAAAVMVAGGRR